MFGGVEVALTGHVEGNCCTRIEDRRKKKGER
jgi:hypothetical protein